MYNTSIDILTPTEAHINYVILQWTQPPTWVNPAALTDFSSDYLFFNLITDDTNVFLSRGSVAIVTECSSGTLSLLWDMPFLSFYSVIHMVNQSQWTRGLHDVICQSTGDMMSLVSDSRKTEFAVRRTVWESVCSSMCDSSSDGIYRHGVTIFICSSGGSTVMRKSVASFKSQRP